MDRRSMSMAEVCFSRRQESGVKIETLVLYFSQSSVEFLHEALA